MNDVTRIYSEIIAHCKAIRELADALEKRHGIRLCDVSPIGSSFDDEGNHIDPAYRIQVFAGMKKFICELGIDDNAIKGAKPHFHVWRENVEICTVTDGGNHMRSAYRRNNKWTRGACNAE